MLYIHTVQYSFGGVGEVPRMYFNSVKWCMFENHAGKDRCAANTHSITLKKKAEAPSSSFPAPPARQRRALKLEIPATTEWTEREGTCLGRRNCPFSAWILSSTAPSLSLWSCSEALLSSLFTLLLLLLLLPFPTLQCYPFLLCASMPQRLCEALVFGRGCSACSESTLECRGAPNHVSARPLNTLMFYGWRALPALPLLKGLHPQSCCLWSRRRCHAHWILMTRLWEFTGEDISNSISLFTLDTCPHATEERKQVMEGWKGIQKKKYIQIDLTLFSGRNELWIPESKVWNSKHREDITNSMLYAWS